MRRTITLSMLFGSILPVLHAADLMDVYRQSLENDPTFKAAYSTFMAASESIPQARAGLLPQFGMSGQIGGSQTDVSAGLFNIKEGYNNRTWRLSATQAIFNYQAWAQVQQAKASVKSAHATFNDAAQNLILRTAAAYLNVLYARDTLNFAEAKKRANKRQLDQATQRFNVGLDAITSVYDAQSAYDQATALVIASKNNEMNLNENLRKLTNHVYDQLAPLRNSSVPLISPEPNTPEEWIAAGIRQNYKLLAARYALQAARESIKVQNAGNWPVFSLLGNTVQTRNSGNGTDSTSGTINPITKQLTKSASNFFIPTTQQTSNIAIAVNFPVFQGGLIESQTRQAQFDFQSSSEQMEKIYRDTVVDSRIAFNTIVDGISKIKADRQSVLSQQNTVESTDAQFLVGTRTMVDLVLAQQHLFEAQEQLAQDQYGYINSILNLKYLAGSLNTTDLQEINAWLANTRINSSPPKHAKKTAPIHPSM